MTPRLPRSLHRAYAHLAGYFWLPCPRCGEMFGGHEVGGEVPFPDDSPGTASLVCRHCGHPDPMPDHMARLISLNSDPWWPDFNGTRSWCDAKPRPCKCGSQCCACAHTERPPKSRDQEQT